MYEEDEEIKDNFNFKDGMDDEDDLLDMPEDMDDFGLDEEDPDRDS
jgi:hypothetical protein